MPEKFRKVVREIMSDDGSAPPADLAERPDRPVSHGWLRKPEWDRGEGEAWELPDGSVRLVRRDLAAKPAARRER